MAAVKSPLYGQSIVLLLITLEALLDLDEVRLSVVEVVIDFVVVTA